MEQELIQYLIYFNKVFISITVLDSFSANQVFSMTTIMSGNFFNTSCDVDYWTAHILSYLNAGLND
jgi:hypothetical protein